MAFREGVVTTISLAALGASVALSSHTGTNQYFSTTYYHGGSL